jgi:hypothetical protein
MYTHQPSFEDTFANLNFGSHFGKPNQISTKKTHSGIQLSSQKELLLCNEDDEAIQSFYENSFSSNVLQELKHKLDDPKLSPILRKPKPLQAKKCIIKLSDLKKKLESASTSDQFSHPGNIDISEFNIHKMKSSDEMKEN